MTPPQKVTSRYVRNLLTKGRNNEFEILTLSRQSIVKDELYVGHYYLAMIESKDFQKDAIGVTPEQAVHRCLEKHGVTFR